MVVGGAACPETTASYNRYSSLNYSHRNFVSPYANDAGVCTSLTFDSSDYSTLKVLQGTSWIRIQNVFNSDTFYRTNLVWPYVSSYYNYSEYTQYEHFSRIFRENLDGSYPVFPTVIMISSPSKHIMGEMQSVFAINGFGGVAPEDTLTIGAGTYVVFPIIPNADANDLWALKLE
jgi:hypothetical protein